MKPLLRLVFTSNGVGVGVVIRSVERYDLVKIKQRSHKQSFRLRLRFRRLRSSENQIVGVGSRTRRINQSQCSFSGPPEYKFERQKKDIYGGHSRPTSAIFTIGNSSVKAKT